MPVDLPFDRRCSIQQSAYLEDDFLTSLLVREVKGKSQKGEAEISGDTTGHSLPHQTNGDVKKSDSRHMRDSSVGSLNSLNLVGSFLHEQLLNRDCIENGSLESYGNITDVHMNNPCDSGTHFTNNQVAASSNEQWLENLHIVTLKHNKNSQFSICDNILQPIELIFVGYLLSSLEPSSSSSSSMSSVEADVDADDFIYPNQKTSSQRNLKQKIAMYNQECVKKVQLTLPVTDLKASVDTGEVQTSIQLEVFIRHTFLQYPVEAYDAILVLCEMEQEISFSLQQDLFEGNKKKNKQDILRDICLYVVYSLSISDACLDDVQEFSSTEELEHVKDLKGKYKIQLQDSLLKVLFHFNDVLGVAQFLRKWNRINDLIIFSERAWESVRFLLGEEENEEYSPFSDVRNTSASSSTWRNVPLRRPLPEFENICELSNTDEFGDEDEEEDYDGENEDEDEEEEEEENIDDIYEDNKTIITQNTNKIISNKNKVLLEHNIFKTKTEELKSKNPLGPNLKNPTPVFSNTTGSAGKNFNGTGDTSQYRYPRVLPPNSSRFLRDRLRDAYMIHQMCPHNP